MSKAANKTNTPGTLGSRWLGSEFGILLLIPAGVSFGISRFRGKPKKHSENPRRGRPQKIPGPSKPRHPRHGFTQHRIRF